MAAAPLSDSELAAALAAIGGFERHPFVAVATSGGPDSLALAMLADRWARARGGSAWAVTVDHRLRPESGAEAARLGAWLTARAIPHAVLAWDGDKPIAGLQAAAREARYRLLAGWCRARGCPHLLTAHHREDQAETYLIRRRAGSGVAGLAAMAAVRELSGCRLVRPLLAVARARLAAFLAAEGQEFVTDPSNRNPVFERARLRLDCRLDDPTSLAATLDAVRQCGSERVAREAALDRLIARAAMLHPAGFAVLDPAVIAAAACDLAEALLGRVAMTIGGGAYPPRRVRLARLRAGLAEAPARARTLGGCRFVPWRGRILVMREPEAAEPVQLDPGMRLVWDRRFAAFAADAGGPLTLGCLGQAGVAALDRGLRRRAAASVPPLVHPALPAFRDAAGGLVAVPHLGYGQPGAGAAPRLSFCPVTALTRAGFTVV